MNHRWSLILLPLLFFAAVNLTAQTTRRVLFLGNSYTGVNNLPQMVKDVALSAGDSLIFDTYNPGGYTLEAHAIDPVATNKIMAGNWDYVVLQGQSQEPITQTSAFNNGGFALNNLITQYNPCGVTMFYVTWGRKNGDASNCASFPVMCTYAGMDSTLKNAYIHLATFVDGELSPVSVLWNYLRQNNPGIELYQPDESHPSLAGSYAAACCFYATIFKHDPTLITFNAGLNATDAAIIRNAAKTQVFDHLGDWDYKQLPQSGFHYTIGSGTNEVIFNPANYGVSQTYFWDFGDGFNSSLPNPTHSYATNGTYIVTLTTTNCDLQGLHTSTSDTVIQFCSHTPSISAAHPWLCENDTLWTQAADSYQWYSNGLMIPVTSQFLPDYQQYNSLNFSVLATVSGCSEMSEVFSDSPQWSGYYFDAAFGGDPCEGDTALFIVLHTSSTLLGTEIIRWYKNDTLLSFANDQDTLFITNEGNYYCTVIDPASNCPFDTTISSLIVYNCGTTGVEENGPHLFCRVYPNPASENITIELMNNIEWEEIRIYSITGSLMKVMNITSTTQLDITGLPGGHYYIRIKNYPQVAIRFIKQ